MRIVLTSDLHYGLTEPEKIARMVTAIRAESPDVVILAGDLGHRLARFKACLDLFSGFEVPIGVLAGNHDIWHDERDGHSSRALWDHLLPSAVREAGMIWLESENVMLGSVAIVGSLAWYDYSAIDPSLSIPRDQIAAAKGRMNNDAHWIDWEYTDPEFANRLCQEFKNRLAQAAAQVSQLIVVTHVPLLEEQITRKPYNPTWGFSNAYFGNLTTGNMVLADPKVTHLVSGHTHIGREAVVDRDNMPPIHAYVVPSEYEDPRYIVLDNLPFLGG